MNSYIDLFWTFARVGGFTFGGGYAMLPILHREVVDKREWVTGKELTDYFALSQCTPGVIAVNAATLIGIRVRGTAGGIAAALGVVSPSLIIITIIAALMSNFADIAVVQNAFAGIRAAVFVLILQAVIKLRKGALVDILTVGICIIVFVASVIFAFSPILLVLSAAIAGVLAKGLVKQKPAEPHAQSGEIATKLEPEDTQE